MRRWGARCLLLPLLASAFSLRAEVVEKREDVRYVVSPASFRTLGAALDAATPVRVQGRVFRAYTRWQINWRIRWWERADGSCFITHVTTDLLIVTTLPTLAGRDSHADRFDAYLKALVVHEQGHRELARAAATAIDTGIIRLPDMRTCSALETAANDLGYRELDRLRARSEEYDRATDYGRRQGAVLAE